MFVFRVQDWCVWFVEIQVLENTMGYWPVMDAQGSLKDLYEDD